MKVTYILHCYNTHLGDGRSDKSPVFLSYIIPVVVRNDIVTIEWIIVVCGVALNWKWVYSLISSILNAIMLVLDITLLIKLECLISWHVWIHFVKVELARVTFLVPAVISGLLKLKILWCLELNVTLWSWAFFLYYLRNWDISHARNINQRSNFSMGYVCILSSIV